MNRRFLKIYSSLLAIILVLCLTLCGCDMLDGETPSDGGNSPSAGTSDSDSDGSTKDSGSDNPPADVGEQRAAEKALGVPAFSGSPFFALNNNEPKFTLAEKTKVVAYESYSPLDSLGRCGYAQSCVGKELMPTEDRESISSVKPSGWKNKKYDTALVDGGYIYNRCHIIGFQLTGENANKENLITGTQYMNQTVMTRFENMVADYVKETGNHVLYRVTPIFTGNNLVADGVLMEGWSVEDNGDGICFCVYLYNVQPGVEIDYATGDSRYVGIDLPEGSPDYILNTNTKKFHKPTCSNADTISDKNREEYHGSREDLIAEGYKPGGCCNP